MNIENNTSSDPTGPKSSSGHSSWKTKAALAVGIGIPLGLTLAADPAAAAPDDRTFSTINEGSTSVSSTSSTTTDYDNDGDVGNFAGSLNYGQEQGHDLTRDNFNLTAERPDYVSTSPGNGYDTTSNSNSNSNSNTNGSHNRGGFLNQLLTNDAAQSGSNPNVSVREGSPSDLQQEVQDLQNSGVKPTRTWTAPPRKPGGEINRQIRDGFGRKGRQW